MKFCQYCLVEASVPEFGDFCSAYCKTVGELHARRNSPYTESPYTDDDNFQPTGA